MTATVGRILITGASGMVGHRLVRHFAADREVIAVLRPGGRPGRLDRVLAPATQEISPSLTSTDIGRLLDRHQPQVVLNAAGLIKQRPAARDEAAMMEANCALPTRLAAACAARGIRLVHVSSDCVFSGTRGRYREDDVPDASDTYGRSKAMGEPVGPGCLSLRTSVIGPEIGSAFGLLEWFRSRRGQQADGYKRVIFPGLPTIAVAEIMEMVIDRFPDLSGLFHVGADPISKYDLLDLINQRYALGVTLRAVDHPVSDRSLDCSRFAAATGYRAEPWPVLIDRMALDEEAETRETGSETVNERA
jgi:dTDP-4-dehydrorhamnose reductase